MPAFYLTTAHSGHFEQPSRLPTKPTAASLASNGLHTAKPTKPHTAFTPLSGHNTAPTVFIANKTLCLLQPLMCQPSPRAFHNRLACGKASAQFTALQRETRLSANQPPAQFSKCFALPTSARLSQPAMILPALCCPKTAPLLPFPHAPNLQSTFSSASLCPTMASAARRSRPITTAGDATLPDQPPRRAHGEAVSAARGVGQSKLFLSRKEILDEVLQLAVSIHRSKPFAPLHSCDSLLLRILQHDLQTVLLHKFLAL